MIRLAIFDYGAGNLHSLVKAISTDERTISIETDLRAAMKADLLVLPGVGAFGAAAENSAQHGTPRGTHADFCRIASAHCAAAQLARYRPDVGLHRP